MNQPINSLHLGQRATTIMLIIAAAVSLLTTARPLAAQPKRPNAASNRPSNLPNQSGKNASVAIKIAPVDPQLSDQVKASAARIDELVAANHKQFEVTPNPMTSDSQFVRRVYLDITGTIPTYEQAKSFIESRDADKRAKLIDQLLNSPGHASHMFNYWGDILRLTDRPDPNVLAEPYNEWVKQAIRDNMPYDTMVYTMLTAEGKIWQNPPTGYVLRDPGMPLDAMNNTVQVFLGTQIGCAQCHDHPFDKWTQREFYEIAAYTFGTQTRLNRRDPAFKNGNPLVRLRDELEKLNAPRVAIGTSNRLVRANSYVVHESPTRLKLPHDYAYNDGKPGDAVMPKTIFAPDAAVGKDDSPRQVFAKWLTAKDNPRFSGTIANRLWKKVFGVGQVEPVDDIQDGSRPENVELIRFLVSEVQRLDFDLKEYLRILYNTQTYQRQATTLDLTEEEVYHFPGPVLRRMTAEQVWDSLLTLAIYNPDAVQRPSVESLASVVDLDLAKVSAQEVLKKAEQYDEKFGRQALNEFRREHSYKGQLLVRASEMPLPMPPDHFLRQFGQGDRELISGSSTEGTVPQVLAMFNGPITHMMLEKGSVIYDNVIAEKTVNDRIDVIFLSVLSRYPTSSDRSIAVRELNNGAVGYGNVIWALVNTREFLFIQ